MREYLEKWTKEVSIEKFEVEDVESYYDKDGNLCIPSGQDATLTLFLINPFHYDYTGKYRDQMPQCTTPGMTIWPDANDTTLLHLTYDRDFLVAHDGKPDGGSEIGTTINYEHPVNTTPKSYTFSLKCNSRPPAINDAAIMYRTVSGQNYYVLAFNCPDPTLCSSTEIHRDIVAVNINGVSYSVQLDSSGNMSFSDSDIFARGMRDNLHVLNRDFNETERSVYFITSDPVINGVDKSFTISFVDSAGLDNLISLDTKFPSVAAPTVFNNDDNELVLDGMNILHTDSGKVYSTVRIEAPTRDAAGQPLENPSEPPLYISYELYEDSSISGNSILRGGGVGSKTMKIPEEGEYTLVVWAEKSGYLSSARSEYHLKLEYATLKAPVVKNVTNGASEVLLSTADNNYIELDSSGKITVHIFSPTETTAGESVSVNYDEANATKIHYVFNQGKTISEDVEFEEKKVSDFMESKQDFGQYCLTVYATKPGYNESAHVTYLIKAHNDTLYVAEGGNDTTNDGSQRYPYATIQHAVNEFKAYNDSTKDYTLNVSGTLPGGQTVTGLSGKAKSLLIKGTDPNAAIDANYITTGNALLISGSGSVSLKDITIKRGKGYYSNYCGGGLYVGGGEITIKDGTKIISNQSDSAGGAVYVNSGTVILDGGVIGGEASYANISNSGGGVYIAANGTFNLRSGTISYNTVTGSDPIGGGITNAGTLTIYGGTIEHNTSNSSGGGIYNIGTLTIYGGTIDSNEAAKWGGGIYNSGELTLSYQTATPNGCTISNNYTTGSGSEGGGIYNSKNVTMSKGTISGNSTYNNGSGGGVSTYTSSGTNTVFTMSGGTIAGNTTSQYGKGVYVNGNFTMSGSALVNANNDVYLNDRTINISGTLGDGAGAKITPQSWIRKTEILIGTVNADNAGKFSLSEVGWRIAVVSSKGYIDAKSIYVKQTGNDDSNNGTSESPYKTISKAANVCFNSAGDYEINVVGTVEGPQVIPNNTDIKAQKITIVGDGYSSTLDGKKQGSTLSILKNNIPIEIYGLTITGGQATNGGGLFINAATTVILRATEISGNKATEYGGGVYIGTSAKLCMYGTATIGVWSDYKSGKEITTDNCGNQAKYGGGVVNYGKLYLGYKDVGVTDSASKGIVNNLAVQGGGIYNLGNDAEIFINSGTIYGNRATGGGTPNLSGAGGGIYMYGSLTMTGGDIKENYANNTGGGIIIRPGTKSCALNGGTIINNEAGSTGGAITAEDTFKIGSGINIPYGGDVKQNDVHIYPTGNKAPSIYADALSYTYLKPANPIHITGLTAVYNVNYQVLTGNISASWALIDPGSYNGLEWAVDTNGYMMIAN